MRSQFYPALALLALVCLAPAASLHAQELQVSAARKAEAVQPLHVAATLPVPSLTSVQPGEVTLLPGLFRARRELTKAYLKRLTTDDILQNYYLEAGISVDKPYDQLMQGWEAPSSQLRGHFAGHWLSAVAHFAATDHDPLMAERASEVVEGLKRCQALNGGEWVGSIPRKYFRILEEGKRFIWSPQYTLHKTMMGLFDDYVYLNDKDALAVDSRSADWFLSWTDHLLKEGKENVIYSGESGGMLELWAELYGATKDPRYLTLASRYDMPDMFRSLLAGGDPLTDDHANASIPWVQGAAKVYDVTGDPTYRKIVEDFWKDAVTDRGMFATTGANAGEFWIPRGQFGRFLGDRTQEHCTVYNMVRVAQDLFRWTGDSRYADYIERALYNGILAQQNPETGMVTYFLPMAPGAKKVWSTETHDFWCCLGTSVQAQAMYEGLIYYRAPDGVTVSQYIPSEAKFGDAGHQIRIEQTVDTTGDRSNFTRPDATTEFVVHLAVSSDDGRPWTLRVRQPAWAIGPGQVTIDGKAVEVPVSKLGFLEIRRPWTSAKVAITFGKRITREPLPGDARRFALLDGPVVLAALTDREPQLTANAAITPQYEHIYAAGSSWQSGHFLADTTRGAVRLVPLYEVVNQTYCVYFSTAP
ncbi:Non-reducing end beta-L-arabinofuranosidase [mine drainage metagenome]|uniref:Non-reducing end beta-L-arabinofuranosidase n=1 Tax=mine drainage metagenome TaxID=410659 RepID=A0A1J5S7Q4_9ZZZZ